MQEGIGKEEFLGELQATLDHHEFAFDYLQREANPNRHMQAFVECATEVGLKFFSCKPQHPPWYEESKQRKAALRSQLDAVAARFPLTPMEEHKEFCEALAEQVRTCERIIKNYAQAISRRYRKFLDNEIAQAWVTRDMASLHRLARQGSGKKIV